MATCTICGDELHPERAEKYETCTKRFVSSYLVTQILLKASARGKR